jgi:membrane-associated protein
VDLIHQLLWTLKPEGITHIIQTFGLLGICLIIFAETGFFALLPGDSLLVLAGIFAATVDPATGKAILSLPALLIAPAVCGVLGDQVGYTLGRWLGQAVYGWKDLSLGYLPLYKRSYLVKTENFYKKWGVFAIVAGRWVPFVRTFAPLLAGVGKMPFSTFVPFNIVGAVTWVWSMVLAGYFLPPLLAKVAPGFDLAVHIDKIALGIIFLSLLPILFTVWRERGKQRKSAKTSVKKKKPSKAKR